MRLLFSILACLTIICSCNNQVKESKPSIVGTWKLIDATVIEKGNTTVTDYSKDKEFIRAMIRYRIDETLFGRAEALKRLIPADPQAQLGLSSFGEAEKLQGLSRNSPRAQ